MRIRARCRAFCSCRPKPAPWSAAGRDCASCWSAHGRGKRGGARVIYYWHVPRHRIYLLYGYVKSKREDLTPQQVKVLAELMKGLKDG